MTRARRRILARPTTILPPTLRHRRLVIGSIISMIALSVALVIGIMVYSQDLIRIVFMGRLCSPDLRDRAVALSYVAHHAAADPKIVAGARRQLLTADDECFRQIVEALFQAGLWGPSFDESWVRYLVLNVDQADVHRRSMVAGEFGRLGWLGAASANDRRIAPAVERLLGDSEADVRYNALLAAATLRDPAVRRKLLGKATGDANAVVGQHAWMLLAIDGALPPGMSWPRSQADLPGGDGDDIRRAMGAMFGGAWVDHAAVQWPVAVLRTADAPPNLRLFAPYALMGTTQGEGLAALLDEMRRMPDTSLNASALASWRAALSLPMPLSDDAAALVESTLIRLAGAGEEADPLAAAVVGVLWRDSPPPADAPPTYSGRPGRALRELAMFESLPTGRYDIELTDEMPDLIRLHAVRASRRSSPADLLRVFNSDQPTTRDVACLVAIERFGRDGCRDLAHQLLASFNDNQRMAGAILAGMVEPDERLIKLLRLRHEQADAWVVRQIAAIGLRMAGQNVEAPDFPALLARRDVPRTTIILAMLHTGRLDGLDWLISPFGEEPLSLRLLLDQLRYWPVLRAYLPDAPPFWLYGDAEIQQFQVQFIRDWYLINRPRLRFDEATRRFALPPHN